MTNRIPLGSSDAQSRIVGIRRSQMAGSLIGLIGLCEYLVVSAGTPALLVVLVAFASVAPARRGNTLGELSLIALRYVLRSRKFNWQPKSCSVYELSQIGRLDLAGTDGELESSVKHFVRSLALEGEPGELTLSLFRSGGHSSTQLASSSGSHPGEPWKRQIVSTTATPAREFWRELRINNRYYAVVSFDDFSLVTRTRYIFNRFLGWLPSGLVVVHAQVIGTQKGSRIAARAAHRVTIDSSVTQALGFRSTTRNQVQMERKRQQEREVEAGATLLKIGAFLICSGESREICRARVQSSIEEARRSGLPARLRIGQQRELFEALSPRISCA
jgi:hypothetical protein